MSRNTATDKHQQPQREDPSSHGDASEHGHTGEGAASALAQLISQEKHRRQNGDAEEPSGSGHP